MAQSNYGALAEGLKLYTDAMRRLIKELAVGAVGRRLARARRTQGTEGYSTGQWQPFATA